MAQDAVPENLSPSKTQPAVPEADNFTTRLKERLTYLRKRRWVQISFVVLLLALALWGFFYARSLLPRTPAQMLEAQTDTLQTHLRVQEAVGRLELLKAMLTADREPAAIERHRALLTKDLKVTFEHSPRELRGLWPDLERSLDQLQADINNGSDEILPTLENLIATLKEVD